MTGNPAYPTYPGVYIQELESPVHSISGVPTAITAFVGAAERGTPNEPISISSVADYQRAFGGTGDSPLDLAVALFYQNGGGDAIVVRVAPKASRASAAPNLAGLSARSPGAWGDKLSITIDQDNIPAANKAKWYNLTVKDPATLATERYVGIELDAVANSPRSLQRVLANSNLLAADASAPAVPEPVALPLSNSPLTVALQGGDAGAPSETDLSSGFFAVAKHNTFFNLLVLTPVGGAVDVSKETLGAAASFAADHRAILIADAPSDWTLASAQQDRDDFFNVFGEAKTNVAVYFPRMTVSSSALGVVQDVGPSAAVAGIYASTDANRGVWKAPAGIAAQIGGADIALRMSDVENGRLNPVAINCLRSLPVIGNVVWGARTAAGDDITGSQWKYVPIRRLALYIEESLYRGTQWVVFEPNDEPLWAQVRLNVGAFMHGLFRQGAFQGTSAKDAYFVKCDSNTNPQADIDKGVLNVIVGFAPLKPAEFVIIKIQQIAGSIEV